MKSKTLPLSAMLLNPPSQFSNLSNLNFGGIIAILINILLIVAALSFFFMILLGGLRIIVSGGKKDNINAARQQIVNAFIGLIIVFSSWAIMSYLGSVFGINLLYFNVWV